MCDCRNESCEECSDPSEQWDVARDMGEDADDHSDDLDLARFEGEGGSGWSL